MARRLPWKRATEDSPRAVKREDAMATPKRRMGGSVSDSPVRKRGHALVSDPARSPSTSPPPERPEEKFMIPGPLHDDKYRMVEDEFLAMAQHFTAHLHRAEYDRQRALAKTQNAASIREIERPVVYAMTPTAAARRRSESVKRLARQREALRGLRGGEEEKTGSEGEGEGEGEAEGESLHAAGGLRGLMDGRGRASGVVMPSANGGRTRAAAGFPSSLSAKEDRRGTFSATEQTERQPREVLREPPSSGTQSAVSGGHHSASARSSRSHTPLTASAKGKRRVSFFSDHDDNDDDDDDIFGIHARRLERKKSREQVKKPDSVKRDKGKDRVELDVIPSFL